MNAVRDFGFIICVFITAGHFSSAYLLVSRNGNDAVNKRLQSTLQLLIGQPIEEFVFRNEFASLAKKIQEANSDMYFATYNPREFRFEYTNYKIHTSTEYVGLLKQFQIITSTTLPIKFGLSSDDVYLNKVFRIGPDTGILYADTRIKAGIYYFTITADVTSVQLHAEANVTVNITSKFVSRSFILNAHSVEFVLSGQRIHTESEDRKLLKPTEPPKPIYHEDLLTGSIKPEIFDRELGGDVDTNEIISPARRRWQDLLKRISKQTTTDPKPKDENNLEDIFEPSADIQLILPESEAKNFLRFRRGLPNKIASTRPIASLHVEEEEAPTSPSKVVFHETAFADFVMSAFVLFVVTFASVVFFGSLVYFAYKRLKKCGDYAVDEDVKSIDKQAEDEIGAQGDLKNPNLLGITEISQRNVVDSIVITKAKLNSGPGMADELFTIQKRYEQETGDDDKADDDVFVMDMSQVTNGSESEFNTITLQTFTVRTPAITATLINDQPPVRNDVSSNEECNGVVTKENSTQPTEIKLNDLQESSKVEEEVPITADSNSTHEETTPC